MADAEIERDKPIGSAGGVAAPPDDGGHVGSTTVPSDTMDQSSVSARGGETAQGSTNRSAPPSGFSVVGLLILGLILLVIVWVIMQVGL